MESDKKYHVTLETGVVVDLDQLLRGIDVQVRYGTEDLMNTMRTLAQHLPWREPPTFVPLKARRRPA